MALRLTRSTSIALAICAVTLSACGTERSTAKFCETLESEQRRILDQFDATSSLGEGDDLATALAGLGASVQAIGELRTYFEKLAKVAPAEIQTEVEIVAREYDQMLDASNEALDNPLGALVGGLMGGLEMSGPLDTIDRFAVEHCGMHV